MRQRMLNFLLKPCNSLGFLLGAVGLLAQSLPNAQAQVDWSSKPHVQLSGPNLVSNPDFNGSDGWSLAGATYDSDVSRTLGSGSMRLFNTSPSDKFESTLPTQIQVTPGKTYTLSAYFLSNTTNGWPSPVIQMTYNYRSATGTLLGSQIHSDRWGNSKTGEWEEMTAFILVPDQIDGSPVERLELEFLVPDQVDGIDREVWIDDLNVSLGRGFDQPSSPKTAFDGKQTRVDELGNVEVLRNGTTWEPFFPLAMYGDLARPDWSDYSEQGFNMEMRATASSSVNKAAAAGMMSGIDITTFVSPRFSDYNNVQLLRDRIAALKASGALDDVLLFYWDNEIANGEWEVPIAITNAIKSDVVDANGDRTLPIYTLNGNVGFARRHMNDQVQISDITGAYIGLGHGNPGGRTNEFRILDNNENQKQPIVFAQINRGMGNELRPRLFGAIAHGARGFGMWRDYYNHPTNAPVEDLPWWDDFPNIVSEIAQMMEAGLIQVPHWTKWSIDTDEDLVDFGTRDLNGEGYLITANYNDVPTTATFTLSDLGFLGYAPGEIRDFFTGALIATLMGDQFDIAMDANSSGVYRLVSPTNLGDFGGD